MAHPLMRMFLGGLLGGAAASVAGSVYDSMLDVRLLGRLQGPGSGWAVIGLLIIFALAGLVCGAIGGAIRRPWWGAVTGAGLSLLVAGGFLIALTLVFRRAPTRIPEKMGAGVVCCAAGGLAGGWVGRRLFGNGGA